MDIARVCMHDNIYKWLIPPKSSTLFSAKSLMIFSECNRLFLVGWDGEPQIKRFRHLR